jgi:uncharacterized damage-inducible protein DinB
MTTSDRGRTLDPTDLVATRGEREVLETFLDYQREVVKHKVAGLSGPDGRRHLVPSPTTLAGLLNHLAAVERSWFQRRLAQRSEEEIAAHAAGDDESWVVSAEKGLDDLVAAYDEACHQSRQVAARFALDDVVPHPRLGHVSLRWIYVHMIEETARHAGHADILREQLDGTTGDP